MRVEAVGRPTDLSAMVDQRDERIAELEAFVREIERIEREWVAQRLSSPMAMLAVSNARKKV